MASNELKVPLLDDLSALENEQPRRKDVSLRRPILGIAAVFVLMAVPLAIYKPDVIGSCRMLMQGRRVDVVNISVEPVYEHTPAFRGAVGNMLPFEVEVELSRRSYDLSRREEVLAKREKELGKRAEPACPTPTSTTPVATPTESPSAPGANVCTNAVCKSYAKDIKSNMAKNYKQLDPCTNFDEYVCSGWKDTHDYRSDQSAVEIATVMQDTVRDLLHGILESPYSSDIAYEGENKTADAANFAKLKTAYDTCMNLDAIKAYGVKPLSGLLAEFELHFPREWNGTDCNQELTALHIWMEKHSITGLVSAAVSADDKDPDLQVVSMGGGEYGLPSKQYYNNTGVVANYTATISRMFQVITTGNSYGNDTIPIPAKGDYSLEWSKQIVDLERRIVNASPDPELSGKPEYYYNVKPANWLDMHVEGMHLTDYIKAQTPASYNLKTIVLSDPWYYGNLSAIIKETPREVQYAYFRWNVIRAWYSRLHKDYTRSIRQFNNQLAGRDPDAISDRWRTCITEVDNISGGLGWIESAVFAQKAFGAKDKALGDQIVKDIRTEFVGRLKNFPWMSDSVKKAAEQKVVNIFQKIGYPTASPDISNPVALRDYYADVNPTTNFFNNGIVWSEVSQRRSWSNLLKPTDRARWEMSVPTINAYYNPGLNEIVFPAGIMQIPVFASELPDYVSYGSFGSVAGHEITHGFDDNGAKYDTTGRYNEWWDENTRKNFNNLTTCFVDQFAKYSIVGPDGNKIYVNGHLTLGENIADAGGISASYAAWQRRHKANPNPSLPGLEEFTPEQMFFISYGTWWCGKVRPAQAENWIYTDPHSPADARIVGTTANSAGFREAFNCPVKKPTCVLW